MSFRSISEVKTDYNVGKKPKLFPIQSTENSLIELEYESKRTTRMRSKLGQAVEASSAIPSPKPKPRPITRPRVFPKEQVNKHVAPKQAIDNNESYAEMLNSRDLDFNSLLTSYYEEL